MRTAIAILTVSTTMSLSLAGNGQTTRTISSPDPFIDAIETMKHSVAPLLCVATDSAKSTLLSRRGTAFFVSAAGEFLTAGHVILDMQKGDSPCPVPAIVLPVERWQPGVSDEPVAWFSFKIANCAIDRERDVAACPLTDDLSKPISGLAFKIVPVKFEWNTPPDGTQVAFTGYPMNARDPMTFRADVAAYRPVWRNEKVIAELLLDRAAWPGSSGSPVFLSDGGVIGILIAARTEEGTAMTILRPISAVRDLLTAAYRSGKK